MSIRSKYAALAAVAAFTFGGSAAVAATASAATPAVTSGEEAGYTAGDPAAAAPWHFRYVQEQVTLPDVTSGTFRTAIPGGYGASVRLSDATQTIDLGISTTPASGVYNAAFAVEYADGTYGKGTCLNGNSPAVQPRDTVLLSVYYDYGTGTVQYAAQDLTTPAGSFRGTCRDTWQWFTGAHEVTGFTGSDYAATSPVAATSGTTRLAELSRVVVTSRTGVHGSASSAPWPVQQVQLTSTGGASTVLASPTGTWGTYAAGPDTAVRAGRDFAVNLP